MIIRLRLLFNSQVFFPSNYIRRNEPQTIERSKHKIFVLYLTICNQHLQRNAVSQQKKPPLYENTPLGTCNHTTVRV